MGFGGGGSFILRNHSVKPSRISGVVTFQQIQHSNGTCTCWSKMCLLLEDRVFSITCLVEHTLRYCQAYEYYVMYLYVFLATLCVLFFWDGEVTLSRVTWPPTRGSSWVTNLITWYIFLHTYRQIQGGPLLVINGVITPINGIISG